MSVSRKQIKEERRRRRELVEESRAVEAKQDQRRRMMVLGGLALLMAAFVAVFTIVSFAGRDRELTAQNSVDVTRRAPDKNSVGFADKGNQHIASPTTPHVAYSSDPPTSGPHLSNLAPEGWHDEPVPVELLVHNLEDGHVVIYYQPTLPEAEKMQLQALVTELGAKVTTAPYDKLKTPIALAAWTRMDSLSAFDDQRIRDFVTAYRGIDHHK
ncbi:MAG: DUF3105 domain-containing protein [Chloroflexia bacterium]